MLNLPASLQKDICVDHINRNPLDCRKANLRVCTQNQNLWNHGPARNKKSSKYKGVYYHSKRKRWQASIQCRRKRYQLGIFKTEYHAMAAYNMAAGMYHGEFAYFNQWTGPTPPHPCPFSQSIYDKLKELIPDFEAPRPGLSPLAIGSSRSPCVQLNFSFKQR